MTPPAIWAAALAALALAVEALRGPAGGRGVRLGALAGLVAGLGLLALAGGGEPGPGAAPLLVTPGASPRTAAENEALVFAADRALPAAAGARVVPGAAALAHGLPAVERLRVVGWGLAPWELEALGPAVEWQERLPPPFGLVAAAWPRRLPLGEPFVVRGRARLGDAPRGELLLAGPFGEADAASLEAGGGAESPFELVAVPRSPGAWVYRLRLEAAGAEPVEEILEVVVERPPPLALLWLESAPDVETREAKAWLRETGAELLLRTAVSRGRFRMERHGPAGVAPAPRLDRLRPELLGRLDLLVADPEALADLDAAERDLLATEIGERGLGLLVLGRPQGSTGWPAEPLLGGLAVRPVEGAEELELRLAIAGRAPSAPLRSGAREISPGFGVRPLARDQAGRVQAAVRALGVGRVGLALPTATYRWLRAGERRSHRAWWSALVAALARAPSGPAWIVPGGPVRLDEPVELTLRAGDTPMEAGRVEIEHDDGGIAWSLPVAQDPLAPELRRVTWRPRRPGWHRLLAGEAELRIHVPEEGGWRAFDAARRQAATDRAALLVPAGGAAVPAGWSGRRLAALGLLFASAAVLWSEPLWRRRVSGGA